MTLNLPTPSDSGNVSDHTQLHIIVHPNRRSRFWFCTWNNPPSGAVDVLLSLGADKYCFQKELGELEETTHWQGVFGFVNARSWSSLNNKCSPRAYWAVCKNVAAAVNYCRKDSTAIEGTLHEKGWQRVPKVRDPLDGKTLYGWQKDVLDECFKVPDDRAIYWIWSSVGNIGKTALCKHMCLKHDAIIVGGAYKDAYFAIAKRLEKEKPIDIVVFNLPRSVGNIVSYQAMEGIKDGMFFSPKYEATMCLFNPPHVYVFANSAPDLAKMSVDRWHVVNVDPVFDYNGGHNIGNGYFSDDIQ